MCKTVYVTVTCALQAASRVILTTLFAIEDLLRLVVYTAHAYVSTCFRCLSFVPVCLAYYCVKRYYCTTACRAGCYPARYPSCGCTVIVAVILLLIVIFFYTYWSEDLLANFNIKIPCGLVHGEQLADKVSKRFKTRSLLVDTIGSFTKFRKNGNSNLTVPDEVSVSLPSTVTSEKDKVENDHCYSVRTEKSSTSNTYSNEIDSEVKSLIESEERAEVKNLIDADDVLHDNNRSPAWPSIEEILLTDRPPVKLSLTYLIRNDSKLL